MKFIFFFLATYTVLLTTCNFCFANLQPLVEEDIYGGNFQRLGRKFIYGGFDANNPEPNATPSIWAVFIITRQGNIVPSPHENESSSHSHNNQLILRNAQKQITSTFKWVIDSSDKNKIILLCEINENEPLKFLYHEKIASNEFNRIKLGSDELTLDAARRFFSSAISTLLQDITVSPKNQLAYFCKHQRRLSNIEDVVSIGDSCGVKPQINRYFNPTGKTNETKSGHGHFFDWTGILNYNKLCVAFQTKLSDIFNIEDLRTELIQPGYPHIFNDKYGIRWRHLFDRIKGFPDKNFKKEDFARYYPDFKAKINYLTQKFISLKNKKTLYILSNVHNQICNEGLKEIRDALSLCRNGNQDFSLLVITDTPGVSSFENIFVRKANHLFQNWNGGNPQQWKAILDQFSFIPSIWD